MPLVIIIVLAVWLLRPKTGKRKAISYSKPLQPTAPIVYDPVKLAREKDRQRREAERIADRQRKEAERIRKEQVKKLEQEEKARSALVELDRIDTTLLQYRNLYDMIEEQLNRDGLKQAEIIRYTEKLINLEQKINRLEQRKDKTYFVANQTV